MTTDPGNAEQVRAVAHSVGRAVVQEFVREHPEIFDKQAKPEPSSPLKWANGIVSAVFTVGIAAMAIWLVSSVGTMRETLARLDERLASQNNNLDSRYTDLERRVAELEAQRRAGPAAH